MRYMANIITIKYLAKLVDVLLNREAILSNLGILMLMVRSALVRHDWNIFLYMKRCMVRTRPSLPRPLSIRV